MKKSNIYSLLLDSSDKLLVVGLAKNNEIIDQIIYEAWQRQSEYIISEIDNILKRNKINPKEIDEIIVTKGPGSFTGLRISLTIAKIFGVSINTKIYALSSLQILLEQNETSICLMNARSNRSYIGIYLNKEIILKDTIFTNEEVLNYIKEHPNYKIKGDTSYVNIPFNKSNILENMLLLKDESNLINDPLLLKAIYLKD